MVATEDIQERFDEVFDARLRYLTRLGVPEREAREHAMSDAVKAQFQLVEDDYKRSQQDLLAAESRCRSGLIAFLAEMDADPHRHERPVVVYGAATGVGAHIPERAVAPDITSILARRIADLIASCEAHHLFKAYAVVHAFKHGKADFGMLENLAAVDTRDLEVDLCRNRAIGGRGFTRYLGSVPGIMRREFGGPRYDFWNPPPA